MSSAMETERAAVVICYRIRPRVEGMFSRNRRQCKWPGRGCRAIRRVAGTKDAQPVDSPRKVENRNKKQYCILRISARSGSLTRQYHHFSDEAQTSPAEYIESN